VIIKLYFLFFHFFMGTFIAGGFLIAMSSFMKVAWARKVNELIPLWQKLAPFSVVLFLPLLIFGRELIPVSPHLDHKLFYFSFWFVLTRIILEGVSLITASRLLRKNPTVSLILYFFTGTFVAIDWGMSLEGNWTSNIYGLIYLLNAAMTFFAAVTFFRAEEADGPERKDFIHVLITLAISWGYLHYAQFIILWMGNKPSEVSFYLVRHYPLGLMVLILMLKLVPVLGISFFPEKKKNVTVMKILSLLVVAGGWLEVNWLLDPPLGLSLFTALAGSGFLIIVGIFSLGALVRRLA
jgi:hypothetical protein